MVQSILTVAVFDEHEIFRRGLKACLREEPGITVSEAQTPFGMGRMDVLVVSVNYLADMPPDIPVVVCCDGPFPGFTNRCPRVSSVLPRQTLRAEQLVAAIRAAAVGLRVESTTEARAELDERSISVLRMLALGEGTRGISLALGYSERTIKSVIANLESAMGAKTRAQCVAEAVRRVII